MSEPRLISPLLDGFALGNSMSCHSGVNCYPAMRADSDERYIVKTISIPPSQTQLEALLLTGAYPNTEAARSYFLDLAQSVLQEVEVLNKLSGQRGFVPCLAYQVDPMEQDVGYDVYLISPYRRSLERYLKRSPMTYLSAVNMGIDLCAALAVCRENGYLYVDLKPSNIFLTGEQEYYIGDLGFVSLDSLKYASLPDRYRSHYIPPEITDAYAELNPTMDTYALGMVLYQVYNNGQLPFDSEESRLALMERMAKGEPLPPPEFADSDMAAIIAKACAFDPSERWASPSQMGHALIAYMQRNGANNVPIGPPEPEPEPEPEVPEEEPTPVETPEAEEITSAAEEAPAAVEGSEEVPDEAAEDTVEKEEDDWIDRIDAILSEEDENQEGEELSLRDVLEKVDSETDADAAVDPEALSDEVADILSQADELLAHETPEPVVVPEAVEIPMPEPISPEPEVTKAEPAEEDDAEPETIEEEVSDQPLEEIPEEEPKPKKKKKVLGWIIGIAVVAILGVAGYFGYNMYYLQTVDGLTVEEAEDTLVVTVDTDVDEATLSVVCVDQYGTKRTSSLSDGTATFPGLTPDTQYNISLEVEGLHKLVGQTSTQYYTLPQTQIISFTATTGAEDGSVILNFAAEGPAVESWTVEYSAEGMETASLTFSGSMASITGLTPGAVYTFTLKADDDVALIGQTELIYTAANVILAQNVSLSNLQDGTITATWFAPEGVTVDSWTARCYNESGYDQTLLVTEPSASFTELDPSMAYTVEITAAGMTQSQRTYITANPINVTAVTVKNNDNTLEVSWKFEGDAPADGWLLVYTVDNGTEQRVLQCTESAATISPLAPGSHYNLSVQAANSTTVLGGTGSADVSPADSLNILNLTPDAISAELCKVPSESWSYTDISEPTSTFAVGESIGVMLTSSATPKSSTGTMTTLFVVRDSGGNMTNISSTTAKWSDMWNKNHCDMTVPQIPAAPGSYTLQMYMWNQLVTTVDFVIE